MQPPYAKRCTRSHGQCPPCIWTAGLRYVHDSNYSHDNNNCYYYLLYELSYILHNMYEYIGHKSPRKWCDYFISLDCTTSCRLLVHHWIKIKNQCEWSMGKTYTCNISMAWFRNTCNQIKERSWLHCSHFIFECCIHSCTLFQFNLLLYS